MDIRGNISTKNVPEKEPWEEDESKCISAQELFSYCDTENRGFITRIDMERLCIITPFNRHQVQQMFDSMDTSKNGELSFYEFMNGFDALLEISSSPDFRRGKKRLHPNGRALSPIKELSNDPYEEFIDQFDRRDQFTADERLKKIYDDLKTENPSLVPTFEQVIEKISSDFENNEVQRSKLELSLQTCDNLQDEQLEQLYENLERRMEEEKAKAVAEEKARNDKINLRLQEELEMKERLLNEIISQQEELEKKISDLITEETERKKKNKMLLKERNELERKVISTEKMLEEIEWEMEQLNEDERETKKRRQRSLNTLSRQISLEEELMAAQVDELRSHNKRLLDEYDTKTYSDCTCDHDALECSRVHEINPVSSDEPLEAVEEVEGRKSSHSQHFPCGERILVQNRSMCHKIDDPEMSQLSSSRSSSISSALEYVGITADEYEKPSWASPQATWKVTCTLLTQDTGEQKEQWKVKLKVVPFREKTVIYSQIGERYSPQQTQPVLPDICDGITTPERIFKIIFVGDSGVGKTSFIHRFCNDSFKTNFHTTIGIDFQVKSIVVNNKCVSLQLWDTAGQERFRCISKQYFRKSDAVIVMYDVTAEETFRNVRQWIGYIKENADDGALILILGNKVDSRHSGEYFIVSTSHGARLAEEYGALFFETSAKSGSNINEAMIELSSLLQEKEDIDLDKALILDVTPEKKKWRC